MNIVDPILAQCRYQPDAPALCAAGERHAIITYQQLAIFVHNIARYARSVGLKRGDVVVLLIEDVVGHPLLILGLAKAGIVTISGRGFEEPVGVKVAAFITDVDAPRGAGARIIRVGPEWTAGDGKPFEDDDAIDFRQEPCRIVLTSGTTGDPKAISLNHQMVLERASQRDFAVGNTVPPELRVCIDLGFATSLGYYQLLYVLIRGGMVVLPGGALDDIISACETYQVGCWMGSPAGLSKVLDFFKRTPGRRANFRVMMAVGSQLPRQLSEQVRLRVCSNLIACYGSTEAGMVATAPAFVIAEVAGAVGVPTAAMRVQAVDENNTPLPRGSEGIIRIKGPYNVDGYMGDPALSAEAFQDGWFYPGDIGRVTSDGLLVITGRVKSVLNIGGDKINPEMIETLLAALKGVDQVGVAGVTNDFGIEEIWVGFTSRDGLDGAELLKFCQQNLPPLFVPRRFVRLQEFPINAGGKIDRPRLRDALNAQRPSS